MNLKKWMPFLLFCALSLPGAQAFPQTPEQAATIVKNILHEMFAEEEKKYPALKAHLDDESKKTFQEAYGLFRSGPPNITIMRIRGSKNFLIKKTGVGEIIHAPRITSIVPADKIEANNMLTIFGENLQGAREVTFSGVKGSISSSSSGKIRVIVPNVEGQKRIYAVTPTGTAQWDYCYVFKTKPPPDWKPPPVAKPTPPPAPTPPPKPDPITKNALGNPELCFGAVGKGCGGFGDLKEDDKGASRPGWLAAGCSEEVGGKRRCWVVPGSIKHDNCCVVHPHGKHCGGPMSDGSNAGEWNHDGNCDKEWDDAVWDVKNGRGWEVDFVAKKPGDLTPASSPGGRYVGGERVGTVDLCAPNDASISARHSVSFCCSGHAQKYWYLGVEDWYICQPPTGRGVQAIGGKEKKEGTPTGFDMARAPSKPGQPKQQPVAIKKEQPKIITVDVGPPLFAGFREISVRGEHLLPMTSLTLDGKVQKPGSWMQVGTGTSFTFSAKGEVEGREIVLKTQGGAAKYWIPESPEMKAKRKVAEELARKKAEEESRDRQKAIEEAMRQRQEEIRAEKQREIKTGDWVMPPPPPPSRVTQKPEEKSQPDRPATVPPPPAAEPEVATRRKLGEEGQPGHCERGTWSPTLRICVEEDVREEAAPPDCDAGMHWSPTLKSCQPD